MAIWSFTEHPRSVGETYGQHMRAAAAFAGRMFLAAAGCAVHALFPFLCETVASRTVRELNERMARRHRSGPPGTDAPVELRGQARAGSARRRRGGAAAAALPRLGQTPSAS